MAGVHDLCRRFSHSFSRVIWRKVDLSSNEGHRPLEISPPGAGVPRLTTASVSSRYLVKGSRKTLGKGRGHRPWFGRAEAKKGGRECRPSTRGRMRRRCWRPSDTALFNQPAVPWASLRTAKKKGVFPKHPRVRRIAPSPKKHPNDDVRFSDWSSPSRQNNGCGQ